MRCDGDYGEGAHKEGPTLCRRGEVRPPGEENNGAESRQMNRMRPDERGGRGV